MGRKRVRVDVTCNECGAVFEVSPSRLKHGRGRHCSRKCQYQSLKVEEPAPRTPSTASAPGPRKRRRSTKVPITCATCRTTVYRSPAAKKSRHGAEYCSRECHYAGRSAGLTKRVVANGYNISAEARANLSAKSAHMYAAGKCFPIPETERRVSEALRASGIPHEHQHVIDLGHRSVSVDLYFPERSLVVEIDERSLHKKTLDKDAERDRDLQAAGYTVRRVIDDRNTGAILQRVLDAIA